MMDQAEQSLEFDTRYADKPLRKQYTLFWGVFAQFMYVGPQVAIAGYFINYVTEVNPSWTSARGSDQLAIAQGLFAAGRFCASGAMNFLKPRQVYWVFATMIIIWICVAIGVHGDAGIAALSLVLFFESCIFPTIFTLSLRGLGRHTKRGASFLVSSVVGGAVFPPVLGAVADRVHSTRIAMFIPLIGFVLSWSFPVYLNLYKGNELDAYREQTTGLESAAKNVDKEVSDVENGKSFQVNQVETL
jgi:FHS family L-fucose permease-like MFS transporter